ncbi:MAG: DUF488 family protein [Sphingomicrobium sp.]
MRPLFTIGHSTRTIPEFVEILRSGEVGLVMDVRTIPRSRTNPQYNQDALPEALAPWQIGYGRIAKLGGLRGRSPEVDPDTNGWWTNRSFHNYADYALSDAFVAGLHQLEKLAEDRRVAIMCSEAVWWRCHRRIIADYLLLRGHEVFHLMSVDKMDAALMTPAAQPRDGHLVYPAEAQA